MGGAPWGLPTAALSPTPRGDGGPLTPPRCLAEAVSRPADALSAPPRRTKNALGAGSGRSTSRSRPTRASSIPTGFTWRAARARAPAMAHTPTRNPPLPAPLAAPGPPIRPPLSRAKKTPSHRLAASGHDWGAVCGPERGVRGGHQRAPEGGPHLPLDEDRRERGGPGAKTRLSVIIFSLSPAPCLSIHLLSILLTISRVQLSAGEPGEAAEELPGHQRAHRLPRASSFMSLPTTTETTAPGAIVFCAFVLFALTAPTTGGCCAQVHDDAIKLERKAKDRYTV